MKINSNLLIDRFQQDSSTLIENFYKSNKEIANKNVRFISFSSEHTKDLKEILMWSHYSNRHCGIRFRFDSDIILQMNNDLKLEKIKYSNKRCSINLLDPLSKDSFQQFEELLISKSKAWKYEREYRLIIGSKNKIYEKNGNKFINFLPKCLIRIDLGANCQSEKVVKELERKDLKHVSLYKAKINSKEYKLDYHQIK